MWIVYDTATLDIRFKGYLKSHAKEFLKSYFNNPRNKHTLAKVNPFKLDEWLMWETLRLANMADLSANYAKVKVDSRGRVGV